MRLWVTKAFRAQTFVWRWKEVRGHWETEQHGNHKIWICVKQIYGTFGHQNKHSPGESPVDGRKPAKTAVSTNNEKGTRSNIIGNRCPCRIRMMVQGSEKLIEEVFFWDLTGEGSNAELPGLNVAPTKTVGKSLFDARKELSLCMICFKNCTRTWRGEWTNNGIKGWKRK